MLVETRTHPRPPELAPDPSVTRVIHERPIFANPEGDPFDDPLYQQYIERSEMGDDVFDLSTYPSPRPAFHTLNSYPQMSSAPTLRWSEGISHPNASQMGVSAASSLVCPLSSPSPFPLQLQSLPSPTPSSIPSIPSIHSQRDEPVRRSVPPPNHRAMANRRHTVWFVPGSRRQGYLYFNLFNSLHHIESQSSK
ncbi:unnamed protein product, partial [Mesorhabditis belari]|uniref:Uncharacterized protein n=1 Tax=Mesorhabditis belari TaxID=2138241 RepID=A0AAF3J6R1_9BILA